LQAAQNDLEDERHKRHDEDSRHHQAGNQKLRRGLD